MHLIAIVLGMLATGHGSVSALSQAAQDRGEKASRPTPPAGRQPERSAAEVKRWNLIVVVADDLAAWAVGAYGNRDAATPNIDRLAREGALFADAFSASGVCTPSRVAMLTGLYALHAGMPDVPYRRNPDEGLPLGVPAWTRILKSRGYATGLVGKWHLGRTPEHAPSAFGIDYFYGFLRGGNRPMNPVLIRDGIPRVEPGPIPDVLTDDALAFVERHRSDPFALLLHYREPHAPHLPVPEVDREPFLNADPAVPLVDASKAVLDDDQEPASGEAIAVHARQLKRNMLAYYAAIHALDRNLGRLLRKLNDLKLTERTILLFTSDQGYLFGHRGLKGKGAAQPIRNHTLAEDAFVINLFDPSIRIPLVVRWPGVVAPGTVVGELVSNVDFFPSILGMLDLPSPRGLTLDGMDFSPFLRGKKVPWRTAVFAEYTPDQIGQIEFIRMIRTRKWKLVRTYLNAGGNQLFDLERDPMETTNLYYLDRRQISAEEDRGQTSRMSHPYAAIKNQLQEQLARWQASIHDPAPALEEAYEKARREARERWSKKP